MGIDNRNIDQAGNFPPDLELIELVAELDKSPQCRLEVARAYLRLKRDSENLTAEIHRLYAGRHQTDMLK